jgi:selenocysteine lyase/cysteine desulfurase
VREAATATRPALGDRTLAGIDREQLVERIRRSVVGDDVVVDGPFGSRRLVYADSTASGRALSFVESFIRGRVLPLYGNTHTEASATGQQTTRLREEARSLIHAAVGGSDEDVVLFCGSGSTGAIDKLARVLGLGTDGTHRRFAPLEPDERPVVLVGPYEHHSNELPWRESLADVTTIRGDRDGRIDLDHLEEELERHAHRPLVIGSFSAASNVTGIVTDVDAVSIALHRHGALAWWDYAAAGPHLPIDMNPSPPVPDGHLAYKDAVFLSPHKLVGGPGTPGVLVAKRAQLERPTPTVPGGGTILFVSPSRQRYHPDPAVREEGGTPAIVESIRAGLVFALKEAVGADEIGRRERSLVGRALASWRADPRIEILGDRRGERLPIVSFGLRHGEGILHSGFVVSVLSDLFGIQARSGCFCAGPYVHRIYPIDDAWSEAMDAESARGYLGAKLALARITFDYFMSDAAFRYVVDAVHLLAAEGWRLLPLYRFDPASGLWSHRNGRSAASLTLRDLSFTAGPLVPGLARTAPESVLAGQLAEARRILRGLASHEPGAPDDPPLDPSFERVRWFPLPGVSRAPRGVGT